jgi:hypothetical protein
MIHPYNLYGFPAASGNLGRNSRHGSFVLKEHVRKGFAIDFDPDDRSAGRSRYDLMTPHAADIYNDLAAVRQNDEELFSVGHSCELAGEMDSRLGLG